jgi:transposase-like protein
MTDVMSTTQKQKAPQLCSDELIEPLLEGQLKKRLAERMQSAELTHHLESEAALGKSGHHRNGAGRKTVTTPEGDALELTIPRE